MMPAINRGRIHTEEGDEADVRLGAGNSHHSTAEDNNRSRTPRMICVSPIAAPGARSAQPRISNALRARHAHKA